MTTDPGHGQGPHNNKSIASELPLDDGPDWRPLDELLEELGLTASEFRRRYPHVSTDHVGFDGRSVIDQNQLY